MLNKEQKEVITAAFQRLSSHAKFLREEIHRQARERPGDNVWLTPALADVLATDMNKIAGDLFTRVLR